MSIQKINEHLFRQLPGQAQQAALDIIKEQLSRINLIGEDRQEVANQVSATVKNAITSLFLKEDKPVEIDPFIQSIINIKNETKRQMPGRSEKYLNDVTLIEINRDFYGISHPREIPGKIQGIIENEFCRLEYSIPAEESVQEAFNQVVANMSGIPNTAENRFHLAGLVMNEVVRRLQNKMEFAVTTL